MFGMWKWQRQRQSVQVLLWKVLRKKQEIRQEICRKMNMAENSEEKTEEKPTCNWKKCKKKGNRASGCARVLTIHFADWHAADCTDATTGGINRENGLMFTKKSGKTKKKI